MGCVQLRSELTMCISILCKKHKWAEQAAHSAQAIITFNHWTLSQALQGSSHPSLDLPALFLRKRKISFTRQIAEQASPTIPYKSFFNQRPLRLGAATPREHRRDTSTPPNTSLSFYPPLFCSSASSAFVLVINRLKATTHSAHSPTWTPGQLRCQVGGWKKRSLAEKRGQDDYELLP